VTGSRDRENWSYLQSLQYKMHWSSTNHKKTTLQVGVSGGLRGQGGIAVGTDNHGVQRQGTLVAPARVWQYAVQTRNDSIISRCAHVGGG
jgi:hypothetical protein